MLRQIHPCNSLDMPDWTCNNDLGGGQRFYFSLFFIEVQLIYNVALITAVQQSDSGIYTHIYIYTHTLFKIFFSTVVYYKILNIVPCAIQ